MRDDAMGIRKKLINHMKESSSADKEHTENAKEKDKKYSERTKTTSLILFIYFDPMRLRLEV